ncbi:MAG: DUF420 domain-containing protein [Deltaproteobacteria bacterium]|nr:DUF420 domain-containing protein [Deltaproteobacteria bacterium]
MDLPLHPTVNATLNLLAGLHLLAGYYFIRRERRSLHKAAMLGAATYSVLFLISYVLYHYSALATPFTHGGAVRGVYFFILITHIVLAAALVPLVPLTLWRALRGNFPRHKALARWVFPVWVYVSLTGVAVYLMLYVLFPNA